MYQKKKKMFTFDNIILFRDRFFFHFKNRTHLYVILAIYKYFLKHFFYEKHRTIKIQFFT